MKKTCKKCKQTFCLEADEAQMVENGEISAPEICEECCFDMEEASRGDFYEFSDADPGL